MHGLRRDSGEGARPLLLLRRLHVKDTSSRPRAVINILKKQNYERSQKNQIYGQEPQRRVCPAMCVYDNEGSRQTEVVPTTEHARRPAPAE